MTVDRFQPPIISTNRRNSPANKGLSCLILTSKGLKYVASPAYTAALLTLTNFVRYSVFSK